MCVRWHLTLPRVCVKPRVGWHAWDSSCVYVRLYVWSYLDWFDSSGTEIVSNVIGRGLMHTSVHDLCSACDVAGRSVHTHNRSLSSLKHNACTSDKNIRNGPTLFFPATGKISNKSAKHRLGFSKPEIESSSSLSTCSNLICAIRLPLPAFAAAHITCCRIAVLSQPAAPGGSARRHRHACGIGTHADDDFIKCAWVNPEGGETSEISSWSSSAKSIHAFLVSIRPSIIDALSSPLAPAKLP